jgi:hypothetical protein
MLAWSAAALGATGPAGAWDEEAHSAVVDAAVARLPADLPRFVRDEQAQVRLRYLGSEPDRWRNLDLAPMRQLNNPDHFFDIEFLALYGLTPETLPRHRYDFLSHMAAYKAKNPDKDYGYDPARDPGRWKEWPGFAPYRICELYVQLKSSWRTFNTYSKYRDLAEPGELEACRANIVHLMGMMSHYVADVAQPLHTTKHYDGWAGPNPNGYVTRRGYIHRLVDGRAFRESGLTAEALSTGSPLPHIDDDKLFEQVVGYILESHSHVEELYALEKRGALTPGDPSFDEGVSFLKQRLSSAATMLAALWDAAYRDAGTDDFRERLFLKRRDTQPSRDRKEAAD